MITDFYNPDNGFLVRVLHVMYKAYVKRNYIVNPNQSHISLVYLGYFAAIAVGQYVATVLRIGSFVLAGERLTRRLRTKAYRSVMRQVSHKQL